MLPPTKRFNELSVADKAVLFLATGGFASYVPGYLLRRTCSTEKAGEFEVKKWTGAGFIGSIEGALLYVLAPPALAFAMWPLFVGSILAVWISGRAEKILGSHDDSRICIDEMIGAWIAVWGLTQAFSWGLLLSFIFFRFFDVFKGPIGRRLQALPGGWGVTLDDVYAGISANILKRLLDIILIR